MKNSNLLFDYFIVPQGIGALLFSAKGIKALVLPVEERGHLDEIVSNRYPDCRYHYSDDLDRLKENLFEYFCGKEIDFQKLDLGLELERFSDFERNVYCAVQTIPYGTIRSYQELAEDVGRPLAYRAVGNALGKNPVPILIPCHRIVRNNRSLAGFGAGRAWKKRLLNLEGLKVKDVGEVEKGPQANSDFQKVVNSDLP